MSNIEQQKKVLIFVVAYNATKHIGSVLDRLPRPVLQSPNYHVLIIDDCSKDETAKVAAAHAEQKGYRNVTVLRNPVNQGYGGNQKVGYRYAIENGFDLVILLHGDGQYAPELVLDFVKSWETNRADVVLGSRMIDKKEARAGGMPLYKWVGNQVLTAFQNWVLAEGLAEYHTGYRAYDTQFLRRIPFEMNTNEFHFDTEILLQAFATKARLHEFSIPTHYGDEICHVNGMQYAWDVMKACLRFRFQKIGFFCSMRYKVLLDRADATANPDTPIGAVYQGVSTIIPDGTKVLQFGAGKSDGLRKYLTSRRCELERVEIDASQEDREKSSFHSTDSISKYDSVVVLDCIEMLNDAEGFLVDLRHRLSTLQSPLFVFSVANVAFIGLRVLLAVGIFNYGEMGVLNISRKRLFTLASFRRAPRESGYQIESVQGVGVPFSGVFKNGFGRLLSKASDGLAKAWPGVFAYQLVVTARALPHSLGLLESAERFYGTLGEPMVGLLNKKAEKSPNTTNSTTTGARLA